MIRRFSTSSVRLAPPRKSYSAVITPISHALYQIPQSVKYFGGLASVATAITQLHPNTIVTLGPPLIVGGFWAKNQWHKHVRQRELKRITDTPLDIARIKKYDELDVYNVLNGMDSQYDHFKRQITEIVEQRIIAYVQQQVVEGTPLKVTSLFLDGDQFSVHVSENEIESFIMLTVKVDHINCEFIKLSLPFFLASTGGKRLGTVQVYLLEEPTTGDCEDYKVLMEVTTYLFLPQRAVIAKLDGEEVTKSKLVDRKNTDEDIGAKW